MFPFAWIWAARGVAEHGRAVKGAIAVAGRLTRRALARRMIVKRCNRYISVTTFQQDVHYFGKGIGCSISNDQKLFRNNSATTKNKRLNGLHGPVGKSAMTDPGLILLIGAALVMIFTAVSIALPR